MSKLGRNDPCNCGSGKKYKHCCWGKEHESISPFYQYSSHELLKILALLMAQPKNHGKNIRIEQAILHVLRHRNDSRDELNLDRLRADLLAHCTPHIHEDPPEEFFTENICWHNGNNIVFPGIAGNGVQIVQGLLHAIRLTTYFPKDFLEETEPVIRFLLSIHTRIALALKYSPRLFEDEHQEPLFIPNRDYLRRYKELFCFKVERIPGLLKEFGITQEVFEQFVFDGDRQKLDFSDPDDNPLFQKPFLLIGDEYLLIDPTSELFCLNDFILNTAKKHSCLEPLLQLYREEAMIELCPVFARMDWAGIDFDFPKDNSLPQSGLWTELLFKIDHNRLVYVSVMTETDIAQKGLRVEIEKHSREFQTRIGKMAADIKTKFPDHELLLIHVTHKSRILARTGLELNLIKGVDYHLFFSFEELFLLSRKWKFDKLGLWKYGKYLHEYENKHKFAPMNTHYSKMKWYMDYEESFYHPDKVPSTLSFFEFGIESEVRRSAIQLVDRRAIPYLGNNGMGFIPCYRKEDHFPVYISQDVNQGVLASCLHIYDCPIWCISTRKGDPHCEVYINGILYWLHEMFSSAKDWMNQLGSTPLLLRVTLDKGFYEEGRMLNTPAAGDLDFKFKITPDQRQIELFIPLDLRFYLCSAGNRGEHMLMNFVIDVIGELQIKLNTGDRMAKEIKEKMFAQIMPEGPKKYINTITDYRDLTLSGVDIDEPRMVPRADISDVLQRQLKDLKKVMPEFITVPKEQTALLNELVKLHYLKIKEAVVPYDGLALLISLMKRQEAILQDHAFRQVNYPIKQACLGHYYNVFDEFYDTAKQGNQANLALRILIEWVACWMPAGAKTPSEDDTDMLLARICQVLNYGALSDEIEYKLREVNLTLLPSGRLGVEREKNNEAYEGIGNTVFGAEYEGYGEKFSQYFESTQRPVKDPDYQLYVDRVEATFKSEWKIGIHDVFVLTHALVQKLFERGESVVMLTKEELVTLLEEARFSAGEIEGWLTVLQFIKRDDVLKAPNGFNKEEVYPWRYNRRLSYMLKPLIPVELDGQAYIVISARHLYKAAENLVSIFHNGTLPLDRESKAIRQLLAECNAMKGKEFRDVVQQWLVHNTGLQVWAHEITIKQKGFFRADADKGDIDILAIDHVRKVIYAIECKNTSQAKMAYDFHLEIREYLGTAEKDGLIKKHVNRHQWLEENLSAVLEKLNLGQEYQVRSLVVSNHVLPTAFLRSTPLTILSFYELKKYGLLVMEAEKEAV